MTVQRRWVLILWVAVAVAAVGVTVLAVRLPRPAPPATVVRQAPPPVQRPRPAPEFRLRAFAGSPVALSDFRGKVVVLNFWASWCVPCREEMPVLERAWRELRNQRVVILGINVADDYDEAASFLKALGITYPNVFDPEQTRIAQYQVTGLPTTIFIDREQIIRARVSGGYLGDPGFRQLREHILRFSNPTPE